MSQWLHYRFSQDNFAARMGFSTDVDAAFTEANLFQNLGILVPARRYDVKRDALGAGVPFGADFLIHRLANA